MLVLRLNAGLGWLLTGKVYCRRWAARTWEHHNAYPSRLPRTDDATGNAEALTHSAFEGGAEATDGAPAAAGRTARLGLDGQAIGSGRATKLSDIRRLAFAFGWPNV